MRSFSPLLRAVPLVVLLVASAIGAVACGNGDAERADRQSIRTTLAEVVDDFADGDLDAVCAQMSASAKRHVGVIGHGTPTRCQRDLALLVKSVGARQRQALAPPRVARVELDGGRGTAIVLLGRGTPTRIPFAEEDGKWKIDNFFGISAFPPKDG